MSAAQNTPKYTQPRIKIVEACDPLTEASYERPDAPWVGVNASGKVESMGMGRLEALIRGYVERRISGCSVLLGGDRGSGKTSMILKVIERLRTQRKTNGPGCRKYDPINCFVFPRPIAIRVHGPTLFHSDDSASHSALMHFTESIHRSLCDEFGDMLQAKAREDATLQEKAAQYRLELETGPRSSRLREMWAHFSKDRRKLESILVTATSQPPADQAYRELVAVDTSVKMCHQIQLFRDGVLPSVDPKRSTIPEKPRKSDDETTSWVRRFADFAIHGGHLLNPLAGFIIATVVLVTSIKEVGNLPTSLALAVLSGVISTMLLNFAAARHRDSDIMSDATLTSLGRTVPVLLRRVEAAGLFPVIIVDSLESVDKSILKQQIHTFARDLKHFVTGQAFVCFVAPRRLYEEFIDNGRIPNAEGRVLDMFRETILVSYSPKELLDYLDRRLQLETASEHGQLTLEFLKHLYLFRAQGNLSVLLDCISSEQTPDGFVYLAPEKELIEVKAFRNHVYFQLAVELVVGQEETQELLRLHPDLLEPLNQVLYNAARFWRDNAASFTAYDLFVGTSAREDETRINFKGQVDHLMNYLRKQPKDEAPKALRSEAHALWKFLTDKGVGALIEANESHSQTRFYWRTWIDSVGGTREQDLDWPGRPALRSRREKELAIQEVKSLAELLADLGGITLFDLAFPINLIDYCPPAQLKWRDWEQHVKQGNDREVAELHEAILKEPHQLRDAILLAILTVSQDRPQASPADFQKMLQDFRRDGERGWPDLASALHHRQTEIMDPAKVSSDTLRSYQLMVEQEPRDVAKWTTEGRILLSRCRRLSRRVS